jgi:hypothetical protein
MLKPLTLLACSVALAFTITSANAKKNKGHNDCAPV